MYQQAIKIPSLTTRYGSSLFGPGEVECLRQVKHDVPRVMPKELRRRALSDSTQYIVDIRTNVAIRNEESLALILALSSL